MKRKKEFFLITLPFIFLSFFSLFFEEKKCGLRTLHNHCLKRALTCVCVCVCVCLNIKLNYRECENKEEPKPEQEKEKEWLRETIC